MKVYIVGLYLEQKSPDPSAIIKAEAPKRIVMQFVHAATKTQMTDAFDESFNDNTPDAKKTMKADIDRLLGALDPVKEVTKWTSPTSWVRASPSRSTEKGQADYHWCGLRPGVFSMWLGAKPLNAGLKKGILGQ